MTFKAAGSVLAGTAAAASNEPLEEAFGDALAPLEAEATSLLERINFARFAARAFRKRG